MWKYVFLMIISVMWGSQFFFAERVLDDVTPLTLSAVRTTIGAVTLTVIAAFMKIPSRTKESRPQRTPWLLYVSIALFEAVLPFFLVAWGQVRVTSSIASIIIGTTPIWTILLVRIVSRKKMSFFQISGVLLGFTGILFVFLPSLGADTVTSGIAGITALVGAAVSYATALVLLQYLPAASAVTAMRNVLYIAAGILIALMFLMENPAFTELSAGSIRDLVIIGSVQTGLVYWFYNLLVHAEGAVFASFSNYFIPPVGVLLGALVLHENLSIYVIFGLGIIIVSLFISRMPNKHFRPKTGA
ncbi:DMT family transporter [Salibacterium qingdaonense]|uniref:Permease of the drug/metabolite transporter (DMT) superfamily n=1 Tax=Salibacterium qingdaonense TaxID=266892 RepID=A0A1I4NU69_9BACI|nr:DMT family transporter [Salibacterium qingdaonense]SFM18837.1 Permease of the drug/metabolite transporter (DMT) superfamily [Salibacterium qingdaonense]